MAIINISELLNKKDEQKENNNIEDIFDVWALEEPLSVYQNKGTNTDHVSMYCNRIIAPIAKKLKEDENFSEYNDTQLLQAAASYNIYRCLNYTAASADAIVNNITMIVNDISESYYKYIDPDNIENDDPLLFETWDELIPYINQIDEGIKNMNDALNKIVEKKGIVFNKPEEDENQKGDE